MLVKVGNTADKETRKKGRFREGLPIDNLFFCSLLFCSVDCSYSRGTMFSRVPHNWMLFRSINQKKCYQLVILDFHCFANRKKAKVENTGNSKHSVRFLTFFFLQLS